MFGLADGQFAIGGVGRLEPQKRFDLLVEAFAQVHAAHPHARLLIAGEGSCRAALEQQIADLGLHDACRLVGHCAEVPTFYHALDLLAQSSEYEGTPNVVLEGMALGTPVVATDAGGTADLLRDGIDGRIVPRLDTVRLSKALSDAVSNPALRRAWVQSARARVESELSFTSRMGKVEAQYNVWCATGAQVRGTVMVSGRQILKRSARTAAGIVMLPAVVSFTVRARLMGRDRAMEGSTQALAWLPGVRVNTCAARFSSGRSPIARRQRPSSSARSSRRRRRALTIMRISDPDATWGWPTSVAMRWLRRVSISRAVAARTTSPTSPCLFDCNHTIERW